MDELRERTLIEMFGALDGIYGSSLECLYYPCHFSGQDCSFCYCPFYPCLNYDLGGELISDDIWSCENCWWIHEGENAEKVILVLSRYPRQKLIEEDWFFYNRILQELFYGEELGQRIENAYNLMPAVLKGKKCEEVEQAEIIAVKLSFFSIESVRRISSFEEAEEEILIPLKDGKNLYGIVKSKYVVCKAENPLFHTV
jgi:hypothetical protein